MPFVTIGGGAVHYQELNPEAAEAVLLVHGLAFGNLALWYFTIAPRLATRFRVVMYDLKSHGRSARVASGYDLGTLAEEMAGLLDRLRIPACGLVGFSYGALMALEFSLRFPRRVNRLALIEAPWPSRDMEQELLAYERHDLASYVRALPAKVQGSLGQGRRQVRHHREMMDYLTGQTTLLEDLRAARDFRDADLRSIGHEPLLLYGRRSTDLKMADRLARLLPGSRLVLLDGGHTLPMEQPTQVGKVLADFFGAVPLPGRGGAVTSA